MPCRGIRELFFLSQRFGSNPVPPHGTGFFYALPKIEAMTFLLITLTLTALFRRLLPEQEREKK